MSDFLLVIPEGWTQLNWDAVREAHPDLNKGNVENWINTSQINYIDELLKAGGIVAPEQTVSAAKLIDDAYFLIQFAG